MCKVTVIMTSYNKPKYVGRSIESVLAQSMTDFELILMDDNSDEETQEAIRPYLSDPRIKFFRSDITDLKDRAIKNRYAAQINKALDMAKGEYITYITDDNVYFEQRLKKMVDFLDPRPKAKVCYTSSKVFYVNEDGKVINEVKRLADKLLWFAPCMVDHCSVMHRKDILDRVLGEFGSYWDEDPRYYLIGDARFFFRINNFYPFHPINEVLDVDYITATSLHTELKMKTKSEFCELLPKQCQCKELREELREILRKNRRVV